MDGKEDYSHLEGAVGKAVGDYDESNLEAVGGAVGVYDFSNPGAFRAYIEDLMKVDQDQWSAIGTLKEEILSSDQIRSAFQDFVHEMKRRDTWKSPDGIQDAISRFEKRRSVAKDKDESISRSEKRRSAAKDKDDSISRSEKRRSAAKDKDDSISRSGPSTEAKAGNKYNRGSTESGSQAVQPTKHVHFLPDGKHQEPIVNERELRRQQRRELTSSCTVPSNREPILFVDREEREEAQRRNVNPPEPEPQTNCCTPFVECCTDIAYGFAAIKKCCCDCPGKIRRSWFIYVFQFFLGLVCAASMIMGITFASSCEGGYYYADPILTILMGLSGLVLVYKWVAKILRQRRDDFYFNPERHSLAKWLVAFLVLMALECFFFSRMSPNALQPMEKAKCNPIFYDYLYYLHMVNGGCLILGALFYLPQCCNYLYIWCYLRYQRLDFPSATRNYKTPFHELYFS